MAPTPSARSDLRRMKQGWRWFHRPLMPRSVERPDRVTEDFPTAWARTPAARTARDFLQSAVLSPLLRVETTPSVAGVDVLEQVTGPVIFVANHSSHLDAPLILTSLPRAWRERTATGAAADYFFDVWWRAAATSLVFNAFPVERSGGRGRATKLAADLLADGWSILMFPEGTRSTDGWVRDLRMGAARLAQDNGVPVVPIAIRGSYQAMPRGRGWIAPGRPPVRVRFGSAVRPRVDEDPTAFTERIRAALAVTLDEDEATWWESMRHAATGSTPDPAGPDAARWRRVWEASRPLPTRGRAFKR